jgi:hypothetical protein
MKTDHYQQNSHILYVTKPKLDPWNATVEYDFDVKHGYHKALQSKVFLRIVDAPCYVANTVIRRDLQTPTVT